MKEKIIIIIKYRLSNEIQDIHYPRNLFWIFLKTGSFGVFLVVFYVTSIEKFSNFFPLETSLKPNHFTGPIWKWSIHQASFVS